MAHGVSTGPKATHYRVWCPDYGGTKDDSRRVDAYCPGYAAERWAERNDADSADYLIVGGQPAVVVVAEAFEGAPEHRFTVSGEQVPKYRATPCKG